MSGEGGMSGEPGQFYDGTSLIAGVQVKIGTVQLYLEGPGSGADVFADDASFVAEP